MRILKRYALVWGVMYKRREGKGREKRGEIMSLWEKMHLEGGKKERH